MEKPDQVSLAGRHMGVVLPLRKGAFWVSYCSPVLTAVNLVLRLVPRPLTTVMIASEIPAAIRPYSIAVAPDSLAKNLLRMLFN